MKLPFLSVKVAVGSLCGTLMMLSFITAADEIPQPEFKEPPREYVSRHEIAYRWDNNRLEQVEDILLIGDATDRKITFYVKTIGNNHHMCNAAGDAVRKEDRYVFSHQECHLEIKFDTKRATVSDVEGQCKKYFCGMMGNLQGDFVRK